MAVVAGELLNENSPIWPKWFKDGLEIFESISLSVGIGFRVERFGVIELGDFG